MEAKCSSKALSNTTEVKKQEQMVVGETAKGWNLFMKIVITFKCIKTLIFWQKREQTFT
jgi:hypothetical protein